MIEEELRHALAALVDGLPPRQAAGAVERLMSGYRGREEPAPVLRDRADVVAYAAYRMPATFAAVTAALQALAVRTGDWRPESHLDVGGGTGAAVWAAAEVWGGAGGGPESGTRRTTVLDRSEPALALGRELAGAAGKSSPASGGGPGGPGTACTSNSSNTSGRSGAEALHAAEWRRRSLTVRDERSGDGDGDGDAPSLPGADLVTVSYVLGELAVPERQSLVGAAARAGRAVVITEPGTPDGHARVLDARDRLLDAGLRVLAPCPHSAPCPMVPGEDWCHFAARVNRSSLHRRLKGGSLPYEDEKFAYVAAVRPGVAGVPAGGRIVRRPQKRKGQVLLELCTPGEELRPATVTKRHGADYRLARDAKWGDAWPAEPNGPSAAGS
ncbi:small ribosomal subunit Rsm22 family protein [Streptomyces marispadix]|uniref:Small ribosomal subunit Rsm22 family protein n=1 Tax=Streptomyces marispadix TaxID=2922868 RepID=A0ABS9SUS0_9ACTN|nr:small ribosomal subunit Rsm22 family protein [Streptomyces marispadix]MCH6160022.1 small ribosomal subunit Rsm22 family protein [Streptomyces marispadix]